MKLNLQTIRNKLRKKLPRWINLQNLVFASVIIAFIIIIIWSEDISHFFEAIRLSDVQTTPTLTILPGTPTPPPAEWMASAEQTNGIVFGAVIIVLLIIAGTVGIIIRDRTQ
ncbi:MAG: hypothetical protein Q8N39_09285 [Pelolinea sp.]|nr:hypothetical protein [Pelolinea sp.]